MQPVSMVEIDRFMGKWYVLANIPTFAEKGALDPIEEYSLNPDGTVQTTYTFRKTAGGEPRTMEARGYIRDNTGNAVWGMQFIWPIRADYRIVYLDADYQTTIIGRNRRDFVWIMSRSPSIPARELDELIDIAVSLGYEREKIVISNWQASLQEAS